jgi:hypothetical protein
MTEAGKPEALAASRPLTELADLAPQVTAEVDYRILPFTFSNDDSARQYDATRSRTESPEYKQATNRTAVIIGEGSLMAALPLVPEDTIVLVDRDPAMCAYMGRYVRALVEAETVDEWGRVMGFLGPGTGFGTGVPMAISRLDGQVAEWAEDGYTHPRLDEEAYAEAHELVRQKAIVPWHADIRDKGDMKRLGKALETHDANVTMANITNVVADENGVVAVSHGRRYARTLGRLPMVANAPILATSFRHKLDAGSPSTVESVGPFLGPESLAKHGGDELPYREEPEMEEPSLEELSGLLAHLFMNTIMDDGNSRSNGQPGVPRTLTGIIGLGPDGIEILDLSDLPPDAQSAVEDILKDQ